MSEDGFEFEPNWVLPPAEHIPEHLEAVGISVDDFIHLMNLTAPEWENFLKGDLRITQELAEKLVGIIGRGEPQFWLNLDANYIKDSARIALTEKVAQAIYHHDAGLTDEDYIQVVGKPRRLWKTDLPWDSQPEIELCEHERDEYRMMARAAMRAIKEG